MLASAEPIIYSKPVSGQRSPHREAWFGFRLFEAEEVDVATGVARDNIPISQEEAAIGRGIAGKCSQRDPAF